MQLVDDDLGPDAGGEALGGAADLAAAGEEDQHVAEHPVGLGSGVQRLVDHRRHSVLDAVLTPTGAVQGPHRV
ncbi:MAG TPA: hypothetical protein PKA87_15075, partial [Microthrixaceae bacterium]|nr:hypothetical protein [Microthrixaceae bacterium]